MVFVPNAEALSRPPSRVVSRFAGRAILFTAVTIIAIWGTDYLLTPSYQGSNARAQIHFGGRRSSWLHLDNRALNQGERRPLSPAFVTNASLISRGVVMKRVADLRCCR